MARWCSWHLRIDPTSADYWGYQPDLAWYSADRVPGSGYWSEAPNLAVEILSPSTRRKDLLRKPTHYFSAGVQELWLIDGEERTIHVLRPTGEFGEFTDGDVVVSGLLAGCSVGVSEIISAVS